MSTVIIVLVLAAICVIGVFSYKKKLTQGCCGAGGDKEVKVKVEDTDESHYPHRLTLNIEGMTCKHCKEKVENALNSMDGIWAEVDLKTNTALVRAKEEVPDFKFYQTVLGAGYSVSGIARQK